MSSVARRRASETSLLVRMRRADRLIRRNRRPNVQLHSTMTGGFHEQDIPGEDADFQ